MRHMFARSCLAALAFMATAGEAQARFMQTDPIGYKDQVNLYEYVGDDPMDHVDASGMAGCDSSVSSGNCATLMKEQAQALKDVKAERSAIGRIEKGGKL